jgi:hypothetical protein
MQCAIVSRMQVRLIAMAGLVAIGGCGCRRDIVPVSGLVTLDGRPLAGAVVTLQPLSGGNTRPSLASGSVGRTDAAGRFTLRLIAPDRPGAAIGEHSVTISTATAAAADASAPQGERVPKAWRDGSQRFQVPTGGTAAANFEIKTQ